MDNILTYSAFFIWDVMLDDIWSMHYCYHQGML